MKALATILLALCASVCAAARTESVILDLARPQQPFSLSFTEATDASVLATLRDSGGEFNPAGWTGLLWYGDDSGGITLTNTAASYGLMTWNVPYSQMPTNGRYSVQILGVITNRTEEWGRGALNVRLNTSKDAMPLDWRMKDYARWTLYDFGLSQWWQITATNGAFYAEEVISSASAPQLPTSVTVTNGLATKEYASALTNGLATAAVTNGLAGMTWVQTLTNGLATQSITNGLATAGLVTSATTGLASAGTLLQIQIHATNEVPHVSSADRTNWDMAYGYGAHNGLYRDIAWVPQWGDILDPPAFVVASVTNGLAPFAVTNGLATKAYAAALTNGFTTASVTNGLAGPSVTNLLATMAYLHSVTGNLTGAGVTNGLATKAYASSLTNDLMPFAETNHLVGATVTNGLAPKSWVLSEINSVTNGGVTASITNGLATQAYAAALTNGLLAVAATNGLAGPAVTNGLATKAFAAALTNGLLTVSATNGFVSATVTNGFVSKTVTNGLAGEAWVTSKSYLLPAATQGIASAASVVSATTGVLKAEADTLASVAGRGGFAGTEVIGPYRIEVQRIGATNAGISAAGSGWIAVGGGDNAAGNNWYAFGHRAGDSSSGDYSLFLGSWAGRNSQGDGKIHIAAHKTDPGESYDPANDPIYFDGAGHLYLGVTNGTATLRGVASLLNIAATNAVITNLVVSTLSVNGNAVADSSITNGLASTNALYAVTNGLLGSASTNWMVGASVTNGLAGISVTNGLVTAAAATNIAQAVGGLPASTVTNIAVYVVGSSNLITAGTATNIVNAKIAEVNAITPTQVTNLVNDLIGESVGMTGASVTNMTSYLEASYTNGTGYVTQQVWRVGSGIFTNFFSRAGATDGTNYVSNGWTRPSAWPVGDGYTVETWRAPETNVIKMVVLADEWEGFKIDVSGGGYNVDWNADGTVDGSYADNTVCSNIYSGADIGAYKAVKVTTTGAVNIVSILFTYDASSSLPSQNSLLAGGKKYGLHELVLPDNMTEALTKCCYGMVDLKSVVLGRATTTVGVSAFYQCYAMENVVSPYVTAVGDQGFYENRLLKTVDFPLCTAVGSSSFNGCASLRNFSGRNVGSFGNSAFYMCWNLSTTSAFTNWASTVGSTCFGNCNLSYDAITNIAVALSNALPRADMQLLYMLYNPGSAAAKTWYFSGSVSNDLHSKNWRLTL